jgi:hypothetical protein
MDVRMAVLRHVAAGGDTRFQEAGVVVKIRQQARCTPAEVWEALWGLVGEV